MRVRWPNATVITCLALALTFTSLAGWADGRPVVHSRFVVPSSLQVASTAPASKPYESHSPVTPPNAEMQSLVWMEEALLWSSQNHSPIPERLKTLEETFFGIAYPFETTAQRLTRLDTALKARKEEALRKREAEEAERQAALQPTITDEWDETSPSSPNKLTNPSVRSTTANGASAYPNRLPDPASGQPAMGLPYGQTPPTTWNPNQPYDSYTSQGWESTPSPEVMNESLLTLEKSVLKARFPNDVPAQRLDRLETAVFHRTAGNEGLSEDERLQRLIALASAQADSNYERSINSKSGTLKSMCPMIPIILLMLL